MTIIVRTSTAHVRSGLLPAFTEYILAAVQDFPSQNPGLLSHEVLIDDENGELVYVSRWRDEQALIAFAGEGWRDDPVLLPGEDEYLLAPLVVRHYRGEQVRSG